MELKELAVSRLTGQFGSSKNLHGLIQALVGPFDDALELSGLIKSNRWVDSAEGVQLDGCGFIAGEERLGRDDEEYREAIKFKIRINRSNGTPKDLISAIRYLTKPSDCQYMEAYPATAMLFTDGLFVKNTIQKLIQAMAPVAIAEAPIFVSFAGRPFRLESTPKGADFALSDGSSFGVSDSDLEVTGGYTDLDKGARLGGLVSSDLDIGGFCLDVGGFELAVYSPNDTITLGHDNLTGAF